MTLWCFCLSNFMEHTTVNGTSSVSSSSSPKKMTSLSIPLDVPALSSMLGTQSEVILKFVHFCGRNGISRLLTKGLCFSFNRKSTFDMFNFLASQHRQLPDIDLYDDEEDEVLLKSTRSDLLLSRLVLFCNLLVINWDIFLFPLDGLLVWSCPWPCASDI